ncbi:L,D-transpeptidase-like protein [Thermosporothrix hazakensis]|uniref:L,D-transpeptidase-like protein n=3 Tax=Thermosporothrix hazakensis TaxID=644383 RepID=A0A326UMK7_THEHA|nr:L,D-transpeptidase-like protein [Thermosporothrix hazakensis]
MQATDPLRVETLFCSGTMFIEACNHPGAETSSAPFSCLTLPGVPFFLLILAERSTHLEQDMKNSYYRRITSLIVLAFLCGLCIIGLMTPALPVTKEAHSQSTGAQKPLASTELTMVMKQRAQRKLQMLESSVQLLGQRATRARQQLQQTRAQYATLTTKQDYLHFFIQTGTYLTGLQKELAQQNPAQMLALYLHYVQQWGDAHRYYDAFDGKDYYLNSSYLTMDGKNGTLYGAGALLREMVQQHTSDALQHIQDTYFLHSMLEANVEDMTPFNRPHAVDSRLLSYFKLEKEHVLVLSLTEQAVRIYRHGALERSFLVTTGRHHRPTPPGLFRLGQHQKNIVLHSYDAPSSPDYYSPTTVQHAIQFWENGYLLHSSPWRQDYGPFTQFPHRDSGGNPEGNNGSHGCINVPPATLAQLEPSLTEQTRLLIF